MPARIASSSFLGVPAQVARSRRIYTICSSSVPSRKVFHSRSSLLADFDDQHPLAPILRSNASWASSKQTSNPELLSSLASGQKPPYLWLGCCDSRVPESTLLNQDPGQVFTHRNIANIISHGDLSAQAAITYAVTALKVKHIVVCGHTTCGGIAAAMGPSRVGGVMDTWLAPLRELRSKYDSELTNLSSKERNELLGFLNVKRSVSVVRENPDVIAAEKGRGLTVSGCMFELGTGKVKLVDVGESGSEKRTRDAIFGT
ncbi:MAG: hypothetical protein M1828_001579 [Chrysothrix sp. TS-e1954]|nr:MAG: hypothetical protein M1828_001579 [Chrysothrix sp. TS-e1954]